MQYVFVIVLMILMFFAGFIALGAGPETDEKENKFLDKRMAVFFSCLIATLIMFLWG